MNRSQLFSQSWSIMMRNPSLWGVALLGLGLGTVLDLLLVTPDIATAAFRIIIAFVTTAFTTAALISMVNEIADGQSVTVNAGIRAGVQRMPRLVAIQLLLMIPIWIVLFLVTGSFLGVFTSTWGQPNGIQPTNVVSMAGSIVGIAGLIILVSIMTGAINIGADRAVVLEDKAVFESLRRGWQLFTSHLSDFIVIGTMMMIVALGIGILFMCTIGALVSSALSSQVTTTGIFNPDAITSNPAYLIWAIFGLLIGTVTEVLFSGVWTLAFRRWQRK